jgi:hypothetical protein
MELAKLSGSDKQIAWATSIRRDRLKVWSQSNPAEFKAMESTLLQRDVASWWIANKDRSLDEVIERLKNGAIQNTQVKKSPPNAPEKVEKQTVGGTEEKQCERFETDSGFILVGPTRNMVTGEIVEDDTLPF